jgi:hypothetical protein
VKNLEQLPLFTKRSKKNCHYLNILGKTLVYINVKNGSKIGLDDDPDFPHRLKTLLQDVIDDESASVGLIICWRP